ncbi:hypothetical protein D3C73_786820 [compost metagenome]
MRIDGTLKSLPKIFSLTQLKMPTYGLAIFSKTAPIPPATANKPRPKELPLKLSLIPSRNPLFLRAPLATAAPAAAAVAASLAAVFGSSAEPFAFSGRFSLM